MSARAHGRTAHGTSDAKAQPCPECGGFMMERTQSYGVICARKKRFVPIFGWWCDDCGEGILDGQALAEIERVDIEMKAEASKTR